MGLAHAIHLNYRANMAASVRVCPVLSVGHLVHIDAGPFLGLEPELRFLGTCANSKVLLHHLILALLCSHRGFINFIQTSIKHLDSMMINILFFNFLQFNFGVSAEQICEPSQSEILIGGQIELFSLGTDF